VINATKEVDEGLRVLRKRPGSKFIYWTWFAGPFRRVSGRGRGVRGGLEGGGAEGPARKHQEPQAVRLLVRDWLACTHTRLHQRYFENREGWKFSTRQVGPPEGFEYYQYMLEYDG
jgi:hypothetical protein